jgi:putative membrane protein
MTWDGWGGGYGWGGLGFGLMHLLWWLLVVVVIVSVFRLTGGRRRDRGPREDRAQAILRERYARGEIDKAEYDEKTAHLKA